MHDLKKIEQGTKLWLAYTNAPLGDDAVAHEAWRLFRNQNIELGNIIRDTCAVCNDFYRGINRK